MNWQMLKEYLLIKGHLMNQETMGLSSNCPPKLSKLCHIGKDVLKYLVSFSYHNKKGMALQSVPFAPKFFLPQTLFMNTCNDRNPTLPFTSPFFSFGF